MLGACSSLGPKYFIQAGLGQLELSNRAVPIEEVLRDERTPPRLRNLLSLVPDIKRFGESSALKPTKNYTEYVKLDRPAVVWVVSASERFKFQAIEWGFPIVGSFNYLGWFNLESAREYAAGIEAQGYDVDVRPARAYSTLGWFRDAILSTMIAEDDKLALGDLADVILHESVHATLYVNGQSFFNESLASFIASKLVPPFLDGLKGPGSPELVAYREGLAFGDRYAREMHQAYKELDALYGSSAGDAEKASKKAEVFSRLRQSLGIRREINNATLVQFKTYGTGEAEFEKLLKACSGSVAKMVTRLQALTPDSFPVPQADDLAPVILPLAASGC
jgi:predicted aminopeptidase